MKALLLATALGFAIVAAPIAFAPAAEARQQVLPPTDEAASAAARQALSGKTWGGKLTVDNQTYDAVLTLADSGRGTLKVTTPTGEAEEMTVLWGVIKAAAGGNASLVLAMVKLDDDGKNAGHLEGDDDVMEFDGKIDGATFSGTLKFEDGTTPFTLTAQ